MTYFQPKRAELSFNAFSNTNTILFYYLFFKEITAVLIKTDHAARLSHEFTDVVRWSMSFAILDEFARYTDSCILMRDIQFAVQLFWSKDGRDGRVGRQPTALSNQDSQTFCPFPAPAIPVDPALFRPRSSHFMTSHNPACRRRGRSMAAH